MKTHEKQLDIHGQPKNVCKHCGVWLGDDFVSPNSPCPKRYDREQYFELDLSINSEDE